MAKGKDGAGTIRFTWGPPTGGPKTGRVEALHIPGTGQRTPMKAGQRGRVVYGGNSRTGRKEGTGPES